MSILCFIRQSSESRPCQVRFNVSATPSDSSGSESSAQSDIKEESLHDVKEEIEGEHEVENKERGTDHVDCSAEANCKRFFILAFCLACGFNIIICI